MDERTRQYLESGRALTNGQIPKEEAPTGLATRPITSELLAGSASPVNFQTPNTPPVFPVAALDATPPATLTPEEQRAQGLSERIDVLSRSLVGESAYRAEQEKAQDITGLSQTQRDLATQLKQIQAEAQAIPLQLQQDSTGRARTVGGIAPLQTAALRNNAIRALTVGSLLEASRGNLTTALDLVDRAVAQRFDPIKSEIEVTKSNLQRIIDSPQYSLEQKNRAEQEKKRQEEKEAQTKKQESDQKAIWEMAMTAAQNGADTSIVQKIQNAETPQEALTIAGSSLRDPRILAELESKRLDAQLTRAKIDTERYQLSLLQEYDGLTPAQYKEKLDEEKKAIQTAKTEQEKNRLQSEAIGSKITILNSILDSNAIDSVVGPSAFSRAASSFGGFIGRGVGGAAAGGSAGAIIGAPFAGVGAIPGAILGGIAGGITAAGQGVKDYFTGSADKLIGQTEQFISKEFLDNLINVKAQGATFGALQKAEQDALTAAASYIGQRRVYAGKGEDKRIVGYDMSESDFKREMETIRSLSRRAMERATGKTFTADEQAILDATLGPSTDFDPSIYYAQ